MRDPNDPNYYKNKDDQSEPNSKEDKFFDMPRKNQSENQP